MKYYNSLQRFYLSKFYLLVPAAIIILACLGSFAGYYLTKSGMSGANFFLLFLSVLGAMSYLTAVLGQFPPKTTFKVFVFGFALELILLLISLLL